MVLSYNNFTSESKRVIAFNMRDIRGYEMGKSNVVSEKENTFLPYQILGRALTSQAILLFFFSFLLFIVSFRGPT